MSDDVTAADNEEIETVDLTDDTASVHIPVADQGILGKLAHGLWWVYLRRGFPYLGLVGALFFLLLSLTPSLLPRAAFFQGLVSGVAAAVGYGLGSLASWLIRKFVDEPPEATKRWAWWGLLIAAVILIPIFFVLATGWQNTVRVLMDMPEEPAYNMFGVLIVAVIVGYIGLVIGRLIRGLFMGIVWVSDKLLPPRHRCGYRGGDHVPARHWPGPGGGDRRRRERRRGPLLGERFGHDRGHIPVTVRIPLRQRGLACFVGIAWEPGP